MKKLILILILITVISCKKSTSHNNHTSIETETEYDNLSELLNDCYYYGIVVATGVNEGKIKSRMYYVVVRDKKGISRTYMGTKFSVKKGDTLIFK